MAELSSSSSEQTIAAGSSSEQPTEELDADTNTEDEHCAFFESMDACFKAFDKDRLVDSCCQKCIKLSIHHRPSFKLCCTFSTLETAVSKLRDLLYTPPLPSVHILMYIVQYSVVFSKARL